MYEQSSETKNVFSLKYVKMEPELFLNERLNKTDCLVFCLIELLDNENHCFANNAYFADILDMTTATISAAISKLKEEKYIKEISFDGRKRVLAVEPDYKKYHDQISRGLDSRLQSHFKHNTSNISQELKTYSSNEEHIENPNGFSSQSPDQNKSRKRLLVKHLSSNTEEENLVTILKPSPLVQEIFDYWTEHGLRMPKKGTKSYNKCVVNTRGLLGGKILGEKYDINQIKTAIDYFSFAALDADFEPADLSMKKSLARTTIDSFIFNQFRQNGNSSLFKKYLANPPKALKEKIISEDKYPRITKRLMRYYRDEVLGGVGTTFSNKEENLFRVASVKLKEFYNKHKSRFNKFINVTDPQLAQWLWESIKGDCRGDDLSKISPGWFSSNNTFTRRLPAYLFRQAVIESRTETYQGLQATHETDFWFDN